MDTVPYLGVSVRYVGTVRYRTVPTIPSYSFCCHPTILSIFVIRMELQSREMSKIQAAISEQLREVAARQTGLEQLNDKLRERGEAAKQRLLAQQFQLSDTRLQQLSKIRYRTYIREY